MTRRSRVFAFTTGAVVIALVLFVTLLTVPGAPVTPTMPTDKRPAVAIGGYDAISYFDGTPNTGDTAFTHEWKGQRWQFASAAHRDQFAAAPERFAPAYDGYCAFAMSLGKVAEASPTTWMVRDGKLYLQQNGVAKFLYRTLPGRGAKADANWTALQQVLPKAQ